MSARKVPARRVESSEMAAFSLLYPRRMPYQPRCQTRLDVTDGAVPRFMEQCSRAEGHEGFCVYSNGPTDPLPRVIATHYSRGDWP